VGFLENRSVSFLRYAGGEVDRLLIARVRTVDAILDQVGRFEALRKADLRSGDRVLVATENSLYTIHVEDDGSYSISGGWFDKNGLSPASSTWIV
jgi:hypothetical protein